jgi:two-component sensor histidine kinase
MSPKILLVEDDDAHTELIARAFAAEPEAWNIKRVKSVSEARASLAQEDFGLILADYLLPDGKGLDLIDGDADSGPGNPVLILTSHGSEIVAAESIKRGALDYVVKSAESFASMPEQASRAQRAWELLIEKREAQKELKRSLAEKVVIIKEVHHRVKNNFQIVSSLLSLQAATISDETTKGALLESENRIRSMALIHEKLYESEDYSKIDFSDYLRSVTMRLDAAYRGSERGIRLRYNTEPVMMSIEAAIPLGLVLNELVTNAFIHAFPDGREGEIFLELKADGEWVYFSVRDNGSGLPPDVDFETPKTLGLELIRILTAQAGGKPVLQTGALGTMVSITIPYIDS